MQTILQKLNLSEDVIAEIGELAEVNRKRMRWTKNAEELLTEMYPTVSLAGLVEIFNTAFPEMGFTLSMITNKAERMRLGTKQRRRRLEQDNE